jgi:predicted GH43/DUF377 family glycosyl hydrolase
VGDPAATHHVRGPSAQQSLVTRTPVRLAANPARVIATLFMPGEEMPEDHSRATAVIERVLALDDDQVNATLADLTTRFSRRHRSLEATFQQHFDIIAPRLGASVPQSQDRRLLRLLIGAYFSREEAPEGTALMSPSIVEHPDQTGLSPGELRFVLSARAVGAGHVSYIEFRTGIIGNDGTIRIDDPGGLLETGQPRPPVYERDIFHAQLAEVGYDDDIAHLVLDSLGARFGKAALDQAVGALDRHVLSREDGRETVRWLDWVAANNYEVVFPEDTAIDERVLVPTGPTESHGIEDARFVRFVDDGAVTYYATYTAYDGSHVVPQLLQTTDFRTFRAHQLSGPSAKNKGMALFPRRIGGQYVSLSRWDRENSSVAVSDDGWAWGPPTTIQVPRHTWEFIQVGNCGSPIETPAGWLVLAHGVGPMRTYAIGATLLDLDDPLRVVATLPTPLIAPPDDERDGYVPNVVYSCGALVHGELMVLPYGFGDQAIGIALVDMPELLNRLLSASH